MDEKESKDNDDVTLINLGKKISLFYVCGRDHCDKCGLWNGVYAKDVLVAKTLVVPRPDSKNNNNNTNNNNNSSNENCIVVNVPAQKMIDDRSSTQVREYIKNSNGKFTNFARIEQQNILHPNVLDYIGKNWDELYRQLTDKNYKPSKYAQFRKGKKCKRKRKRKVGWTVIRCMLSPFVVFCILFYFVVFNLNCFFFFSFCLFFCGMKRRKEKQQKVKKR